MLLRVLVLAVSFLVSVYLEHITSNMGSGQSVPCVDPLFLRPVSILECMDSNHGGVDPVRYMRYRHRQDEEMRRIASIIRKKSNKRQVTTEEEDVLPPPKRRRQRKKAVLEYIDDDGIRRAVPPKQSTWYIQYVSNPAFSPGFHKKFRRRFRVPFQQFKELVEDAKESGYFDRWTSVDATKKESSPIELMILGSLRYIGRGWTFDDLEEVTAVSEETHRSFFHVFIDYGNSVLFDRHVKTPTNEEEIIRHHMYEMEQAGFHGCIGSTDATHVMLEKCSARLHNQHKGFKMSHTARTYNMTVNHRRRILSTTRGHPARWNDKTLILFDDFARGIKEGRYLGDVEFELFEWNSAGDAVVAVRYRGAWLMVDNGYLSWPTTVPPTKTTTDRREIRWSQWLE